MPMQNFVIFKVLYWPFTAVGHWPQGSTPNNYCLAPRNYPGRNDVRLVRSEYEAP